MNGVLLAALVGGAVAAVFFLWWVETASTFPVTGPGPAGPGRGVGRR